MGDSLGGCVDDERIRFHSDVVGLDGVMRLHAFTEPPVAVGEFHLRQGTGCRAASLTDWCPKNAPRSLRNILRWRQVRALASGVRTRGLLALSPSRATYLGYAAGGKIAHLIRCAVYKAPEVSHGRAKG